MQINPPWFSDVPWAASQRGRCVRQRPSDCDLPASVVRWRLFDHVRFLRCLVASYIFCAHSSYIVTSPDDPLVHATGPSSPIVVTGLPLGVGYRFVVTPVNAVGSGPAPAPWPPGANRFEHAIVLKDFLHFQRERQVRR
mgnify:CR=1 FL=1